MAGLQERRRSLAGRTGCGLCGVDSLDAAMRPVADDRSATRHGVAPAIERAMAALPAAAAHQPAERRHPCRAAGRRPTERCWRCARMSAGTTRSTSWAARWRALGCARAGRLRRGDQPLLLRDGAEGGGARRRGDRRGVGADVARHRDRRAGRHRAGRPSCATAGSPSTPTPSGSCRERGVREQRRCSASPAGRTPARPPWSSGWSPSSCGAAGRSPPSSMPITTSTSTSRARDSFRHRAAGATEVAVVGGQRYAIMREQARADAWPRCWRASRRPTSILIERLQARAASQDRGAVRRGRGEPLAAGAHGSQHRRHRRRSAACRSAHLPWFRRDDIAGIADFIAGPYDQR